MPRKTNIESKIDMLTELMRDSHRDTKSALEKLDAKVEKIDSRVDNLDVTVGKQAVTLQSQQRSLDEHIRRTNILEDKVESEVSKVFRKIDHHEAEMSKKIAPLKTTDTKIKVILKIVGVVLGSGAAAGGAGLGLSKLIAVIFGGDGGH